LSVPSPENVEFSLKVVFWLTFKMYLLLRTSQSQ